MPSTLIKCANTLSPTSILSGLTDIITQVIQKIGLCISLYDVLWTSEGLIGHGTGLVNVNGTVHYG